ncbi:hypothetical protein D6E03_09045 [Moraxella catarrhalis]|nr:hypothetical protein D6E03_09045 [Moraxella catarrhalis]
MLGLGCLSGLFAHQAFITEFTCSIHALGSTTFGDANTPVATMAVAPPDYRFEPSVVMLAVSPVVLMVLLPALVTFDLA